MFRYVPNVHCLNWSLLETLPSKGASPVFLHLTFPFSTLCSRPDFSSPTQVIPRVLLATCNYQAASVPLRLYVELSQILWACEDDMVNMVPQPRAELPVTAGAKVIATVGNN